jgi:hypothetical protein
MDDDDEIEHHQDTEQDADEFQRFEEEGEHEGEGTGKDGTPKLPPEGGGRKENGDSAEKSGVEAGICWAEIGGSMGCALA